MSSGDRLQPDLEPLGIFRIPQVGEDRSPVILSSQCKKANVMSD
jgi:hypothetical protein